jgi:hypothetical protein
MVEAGQKFHMVTAISFAGRVKQGLRSWNVKCDCGKEWVVQERSLNQRTRSCGCDRMNHLTFYRHGKHMSSEYRIWAMMVQRCTNSDNDNFVHYGKRGISVCERWLKFENFYQDMGQRPSKIHSIDRIDNDGNYEPGNVKWSTRREQMRNTRRNRSVIILGKTMVMLDAANLLGVKRESIYWYARYHKVSHQQAVDFYVNKYPPVSA